MNKDNVKIYENPADNVVSDALSDFLRDSAQKMLKVAIEEEVQNFISSYKDKRLSNGNKQVVRNGYLPERIIQTGIGNVSVSVPRVRDRGDEGIRFTSTGLTHFYVKTV